MSTAYSIALEIFLGKINNNNRKWSLFLNIINYNIEKRKINIS